jgi:hypothetical protein
MPKNSNRSRNQGSPSTKGRGSSGAPPAPLSSPARVPWHKKWRGGIRAAETAIVVGLWATGITAADVVFIALLLVTAFLIGAVAIIADPVRSRITKTALALALAVGLSVSGAVAVYRHQAQPVSEALLAAQLQEMRLLQDFISGEPDFDLRQKFDFPGIVKFNLRLDKRSLAPGLVSDQDSKQIDEFFFRGNGVVSLLHSKYYTVNDGAIRMALNAREIGAINATKKYTDNLNRLQEFEDSSLLPSAVRADVKDLHKAITDNIGLLFDPVSSIPWASSHWANSS